MSTRRTFVQSSLAAAGAFAVPFESPVQAAQTSGGTKLPWYRRAYRWGQTNITEKDPVRYDITWWREFWKKTEVQAVIINAGGIVAYYPSKFPLHHRAEFLNGRDLFGELTNAAHADGLFVMARMDSNRTAEDFFKAHPDWFARNSKGEPIRAADKYVACINSPYYDSYLPDVLREIVERSHPDGFTDNSWAGLGRESICYCDNCARKFREKAGSDLPKQANWDDPVYRKWILWSYDRRTELWELNNRTTTASGGPDCIWSGMMSGSITSLSRSFRDLRAVSKRAGILMLDHQRRDDDTGFQQNGDTGKRVHGMLGWDKLAPESMAMYESGPGYYRVASKPAPEARMWMISGMAGGIQPWWHYVGAYHEDRRMYNTPVPIMRWAKQNEQYLVNRQPVATVGVLWSQRNTDFFGRNDAADLVDAPYTGVMHALVRARIPYLPIHVDDLDSATGLTCIVAPNLGALSDQQCSSIRNFVTRAGSLIATGVTSLYDEWGDPRADYALGELFGAHRTTPAPHLSSAARGGRGTRGEGQDRFAPDGHTYLRLIPEMRASVYGPKAGDEPAVSGKRHPVLQGFNETDLLAFGGTLTPLRVSEDAVVSLTYVPPFPTYPPETSWMREPKTSIPGLVLRQQGNSRVGFLPADLDRRYAKEHLPDHGNLLANLVRWASGNHIPISVSGAGMIDCHVYRQQNKVILHLVNLTSAATWRAPIDELISVGPIVVRLAPSLSTGLIGQAQLLVSGKPVKTRSADNGIEFEVPSILDHECVLLS